MQLTKQRIWALEILAGLHAADKTWVLISDMLSEDEKHVQIRRDSVRRVLAGLVIMRLVERQEHPERLDVKLYRLTPMGLKALEDYRAGFLGAKTATAEPSLVTPERALLLMQLEYASDDGLLLSGVAGFSTQRAQAMLYKLVKLEFSERITAKPPHFSAHRGGD